MGNILHLSHMSEEAAIVVHAAVDVAPNNAICHFTLGNIYAVSYIVFVYYITNKMIFHLFYHWHLMH